MPCLVPMARGKHLFPCRTQQLSLAAVTILGVHPWENSTVPNYMKSSRKGAFYIICVLETACAAVVGSFSEDVCQIVVNETLKLPSARTKLRI